ncbi:MAG: DUF302 domain-containing protein [Nitrospinae bacterium]|nr:DUF302 domain-containing protein [Nitrospinota bacterium]
MKLGIDKTVAGEFDTVLEKTKEALKSEGFGILTTIDVKATMKEKLGADFENYVILGACNPPLAHKALTATREVGLLMPCNVVVREVGPGRISVSAVNPAMFAQVMPEVDLSEMATQASAKLTTAIGKV